MNILTGAGITLPQETTIKFKIEVYEIKPIPMGLIQILDLLKNYVGAVLSILLQLYIAIHCNCCTLQQPLLKVISGVRVNITQSPDSALFLQEYPN